MKLPFHHRTSIRLHAATKTSSDSSKTRVRLLSDNKDLGKKGDIIMVSKAFWINVLQPKKGAEVISDAELLRIETEAKEASLKAVADAKETIEQISALEKISLKRKIGKNNKLFGTVTVKNILDELKLKVAPHSAEVLSLSRSIAMVKIVDVNDPTSAVDYSKVGEIRQGGQFRVSLQVHPSLEHVSFLLDILPE